MMNDEKLFPLLGGISVLCSGVLLKAWILILIGVIMVIKGCF